MPSSRVVILLLATERELMRAIEPKGSSRVCQMAIYGCQVTMGGCRMTMDGCQMVLAPGSRGDVWSDGGREGVEGEMDPASSRVCQMTIWGTSDGRIWYIR